MESLGELKEKFWFTKFKASCDSTAVELKILYFLIDFFSVQLRDSKARRLSFTQSNEPQGQV